MRVRKTFGPLAVVVVVGLLAAVAGCTFGLGGDSGRDTPYVPPGSILVKIVNETDQPLDPQIYVGAVADGLDALFTSANKRTDFGLGGVGLLTKDVNKASFVVDCEQVYIATRGGIFGPDLKAPTGRGQQYILEKDVNIRCGDVVTFTFASEGNVLRASYSVETLNE